MVDTFYISDTHFSHDNVLQFESLTRPFSDIDDHDEELIKRWNCVVGVNDKVIHLGDVCFRPATKLDAVMSRLNGKKTLLLGNHDTAKIERYTKWFCRVYSALEDKENGILFSHYPVHPSQLDYRYKINVHGHLHSQKIDDNRYVNICCEHTNLTPISHNELMVKIKEQSHETSE